ncbi:hypothetical protein BGZ73_004094 [Actinomortierella ambigua]|nr:hypothetical protein BGZ73_004094 [Actinomortierella ambigua]
MSATKHNLVLVRHGRSIANEENRIISDPSNGAIGDNNTTKKRYGLSSAGKAMVAESAASLAQYIEAYSNKDAQIQIHIVCSPFDRTRDTAAIVYEGLQAKWSATATAAEPSSTSDHDHRLPSGRVVRMAPPVPNADLVERFFGDFEGRAPSTSLYESVWALDAQDPGHNEHGVESLQQVMKRQRRVMSEWAKTVVVEMGTTGEGEEGAPKKEETAKDKEVESWIVYVGHGDPLQILQTNMRGWALERHRELQHHEVAEWRHVEWCESLAEHYCVAPIDGVRRERALASLS